MFKHGHLMQAGFRGMTYDINDDSRLDFGTPEGKAECASADPYEQVVAVILVEFDLVRASFTSL